MKLGWEGPYQFYPCETACPICQAKLVTSTPLDWHSLRGLFHDFGVTCHCVACNIRYRAFGTVPLSRLFIVTTFLVMATMSLFAILVFWVFSSWVVRGLVIFLYSLILIKLPGILFSNAQNVWWKLARLEKILDYENMDKC